MKDHGITWKFEERLKYALIPGPLYIAQRAMREARKGESEIALLPVLVDRNRNAIDAGANKGVYTYFISKLARHTYAYEPNPKLFEMLKKATRKNVSAFPFALSDTSGDATLMVPFGPKGHSNQGASLNPSKIHGDHTAVTVEAKRIDDLDLKDIGFIKIDVEGFEEAVIAGALKTIARDRPNLLVEIEQVHTKTPIEDSLRKITALGYQGLFLRHGTLHPLSAFDPERHHRQRDSGYVFNFVFLPEGTAFPR